jgi:pyruvate dehydrogenase E1 component alpha subunit
MDPSLLLQLHHEMLKIRLVEEAIVAHYPELEMRCPVHLCIGQEAAAAGVCAALSREDYAFSNHRSHGHYLAKGGDVKAMIAELYGKETGCCRGYGGSMHLIDLRVGFVGATPIVGSTIPIAVGAAFAAALRGESRVAVAFFGDAATEEGVFHESLNFAALKKLPVLFCCENNSYSVYSPLSVRQPPGRPICALARAHGIESRQGDGNEVVEVYESARSAVLKARSGGGPSFLEFETYRWREHCGPNYDNDLGYRPMEEFSKWREKCPIKSMEARLIDERVLSPQQIEQIRTDLRAEIETAFSLAKTDPFPESEIPSERVFAPTVTSGGERS